MIEERIKELIRGMEEQNKLERITHESMRTYAEAQHKFLEKRQENFEKRTELGKMMSTLGKNIVLNTDGKTYCVSYSRKGGVAFIYEAITPKEADIAISVNKLQYGDTNHGQNSTPI